MGSVKFQIRGSDYVGAFATATDTLCFLVRDATEAAKRVISEALGAETIPVSVGGSGFIGILSKANSNGVLLANIATPEEIAAFKGTRSGLNVGVLESNLNAVGNNILANDKIAFVNSAYSGDEERRIGDALGVETIRLDIGGLPTVGASNILTNKGMVLNNRAAESEIEEASKLVENYSQSTANLGSLSLRLSTISNSNGLLVGAETTGFEMARIAEGLGL